MANQELKSVINWLANNTLSLNTNNCIYILFSRRGVSAVTNKKLMINQTEIECTEQIKFLGYIVDNINLIGNLIYNLLHIKISKNFVHNFTEINQNQMLETFKIFTTVSSTHTEVMD